jgi:hypothetical protein
MFAESWQGELSCTGMSIRLPVGIHEYIVLWNSVNENKFQIIEENSWKKVFYIFSTFPLWVMMHAITCI